MAGRRPIIFRTNKYIPVADNKNPLMIINLIDQIKEKPKK